MLTGQFRGFPKRPSKMNFSGKLTDQSDSFTLSNQIYFRNSSDNTKTYFNGAIHKSVWLLSQLVDLKTYQI